MPDKLKKGWTRVAFGDVVRLSRERSRDPLSDGFERYIGLEHLDPEDLKIRRWGNVADGTTFTSVFRAGQVLFGKRRAYQKKLAVPDFDGLCSGDIYVLEPKNKHLLPELLPFICQTDSFFDHAVSTSAGSLSPRTNWKSLAEYEFALPPLDEQRRIAEVLGGIELTCKKYQDCLEIISHVLISAAHNFINIQGISLSSSFEKYPLPPNWAWTQVKKVLYVMSGNGEPQFSPYGDTLFFKVSDFNRNIDELKITHSETTFNYTHNKQLNLFYDGTVIFPKRGASIFLNKVGVVRTQAALDPNIMGLIPDKKYVISDYLYWLIKCIGLWRIADTTSLPQLNHNHINSLIIPLPSIKVQTKIVNKLNNIYSDQYTLKHRISELFLLRSQLIKESIY